MTTRRTIPENPQPGERYAERLAAGWFVKRLDHADRDGRYFTTIAGPLTEADARLLVFGARALEELWRLWNDKEWCRYKADYLRGHLSYHGMLYAKESPIRAALPVLEGKS